VLDMGNSGTAARLLCGLLAGHPIFAVMTGDASLRKRPMKRVTEPLSATGARFATRAGGRLPLAVEGTGDALPLDYVVPVASAQVKSACLLAGLCAPGTTRVVEPEPTRDHTENMLRHFGATVSVTDTPQGRVVTLEGQPELVAAPVVVPGDPSSAAFPIVAALLVPGSRLRIEGVGLNPLRTGLFTTLREMGAALAVENARTEGGEPVGDIVAEFAALRGIDVPPERAPSMIDEYPILAVVAAAASGTTWSSISAPSASWSSPTLTVPQDATGGSFTLTASYVSPALTATTAALTKDATTAGIEAAIESAVNAQSGWSAADATVTQTGAGKFNISVKATNSSTVYTLTLATTSSLTGAAGYEGELAFTGAGVDTLLGASESVSSTLEVQCTDSSKVQTYLQIPCIVRKVID